MTVLAAPPEAPGSVPPVDGVVAPEKRRPSGRRHRIGLRLGGRLGEAGRVFVGAAAVYLAVGLLLDLVFHVFPDDAVSRLANGFYVLYSRDPHAAAVGFVWNPLTSLADLVPLFFRPVWPALASHDVAATIVTALAMAGAVHQMRAALFRLGVSRAPRMVVTALFALNPMSLFFGANGMSEALYVFTLVATTRYLLEWSIRGGLRPLVYAGSMLALAYLARNEAIAAAVLAGGLVLVLGGERSAPSLRARLPSAINDAVIVLLPFAVTFAGWALASYVITGSFFQQFQGNAVQVRSSSTQFGTLADRFAHEIAAVGSLAPLLLVVLAGASVLVWRSARHRVLVPLAVLGGGLAFDLAGYASRTLLPWYRYYILAVPLCALLVGVLLAEVEPIMARRAGRRWKGRGAIRAPLSSALLGAALLVPALPSTYAAMLSTTLGQGETSEYLAPLLHPRHAALDRAARSNFSHVTSLAGYLDRMHLPNGDVVVDNTGTCVPNIILAVTNPEIFVIPNDRDYQRVLADPLVFHAHYLLVTEPVGIDRVSDSVLLAYPSIYADGAGFTVLAHEFAGGGLCPAFRLFRVTGPPPAPGSVVGGA